MFAASMSTYLRWRFFGDFTKGLSEGSNYFPLALLISQFFRRPAMEIAPLLFEGEAQRARLALRRRRSGF